MQALGTMIPVTSHVPSLYPCVDVEIVEGSGEIQIASLRSLRLIAPPHDFLLLCLSLFQKFSLDYSFEELLSQSSTS